jgi:hypothetical protein
MAPLWHSRVQAHASFTAHQARTPSTQTPFHVLFIGNVGREHPGFLRSRPSVMRLKKIRGTASQFRAATGGGSLQKSTNLPENLYPTEDAAPRPGIRERLRHRRSARRIYWTPMCPPAPRRARWAGSQVFLPPQAQIRARSEGTVILFLIQ